MRIFRIVNFGFANGEVTEAAVLAPDGGLVVVSARVLETLCHAARFFYTEGPDTYEVTFDGGELTIGLSQEPIGTVVSVDDDFGMAELMLGERGRYHSEIMRIVNKLGLPNPWATYGFDHEDAPSPALLVLFDEMQKSA